MNTDIIIPESVPTFDVYLELKTKVRAMLEQIKEWDKQLEKVGFSYVDENGPQNDGQKFYWNGHDKDEIYVAEDTQDKLIEFALENWSTDEMKALLLHGAIKHGMFRKLLTRDAEIQAQTLDPQPTPEEIETGVELIYSRFFKTRIKDVMKDGTKLPKKLLSVDSKFITA